MRLTVPQIKKINDVLQKAGYTETKEIINQSDDETILALLAGDISCLDLSPTSTDGSENQPLKVENAKSRFSPSVGSLSAPVGVPETASDKIPFDENKTDIEQNKNVLHDDSSRAVSGSLPASNNMDSEVIEGGSLPADIADCIDGIIQSYMTKFHIDDMKKATAEQWRGACMLIGDYIQKNRLLIDTSNKKTMAYDTDKIEQLLKLWACLCASYSKPTLASDFISFTGISSTYFYDHAGHELTSGRANLRKKMMELQEAGLASGLVDGRKNPTGTIFFLKNWHGWKDSREVVHTASGASVGADALPILGDNGSNEV